MSLQWPDKFWLETAVRSAIVSKLPNSLPQRSTVTRPFALIRKIIDDPANEGVWVEATDGETLTNFVLTVEALNKHIAIAPSTMIDCVFQPKEFNICVDSTCNQIAIEVTQFEWLEGRLPPPRSPPKTLAQNLKPELQDLLQSWQETSTPQTAFQNLIRLFSMSEHINPIAPRPLQKTPTPPMNPPHLLDVDRRVPSEEIAIINASKAWHVPNLDVASLTDGASQMNPSQLTQYQRDEPSQDFVLLSELSQIPQAKEDEIVKEPEAAITPPPPPSQTAFQPMTQVPGLSDDSQLATSSMANGSDSQPRQQRHVRFEPSTQFFEENEDESDQPPADAVILDDDDKPISLRLKSQPPRDGVIILDDVDEDDRPISQRIPMITHQTENHPEERTPIEKEKQAQPIKKFSFLEGSPLKHLKRPIETDDDDDNPARSPSPQPLPPRADDQIAIDKFITRKARSPRRVSLSPSMFSSSDSSTPSQKAAAILQSQSSSSIESSQPLINWNDVDDAVLSPANRTRSAAKKVQVVSSSIDGEQGADEDHDQRSAKRRKARNSARTSPENDLRTLPRKLFEKSDEVPKANRPRATSLSVSQQLSRVVEKSWRRSFGGYSVHDDQDEDRSHLDENDSHKRWEYLILPIKINPIRPDPSSW